MPFNSFNIKSFVFTTPAFVLGLAGILLLAPSGYAGSAEKDATSLDAGFRQMYSLEFAAAHKTFKAWQELHPEDPLGHAANAAAYLFAEFERLHILELDLFTEDDLKTSRRVAPDQAVKDAFESELAKADETANRILSQFADDANALFSRVLTDGLRGNYAALVANEKGDGLNYLKSSRVTAEKLIALDPGYYDAYFAIGIENYILGLRSAPTRWFLRLSGAQTNKDKGITSLKITADKGRYLGPYSSLLLAIAALRNHDRDTAKKLLADLARQFPQNRLYRMELARLE